MTTDEIAKQLAPLIRWEPGMADVDGDRVVRLNDFGDVDIGYANDRGEVDWHPQAYMNSPDLTDDSTLDLLWGQLRRRFAACGWKRWSREDSPGPVGMKCLLCVSATFERATSWAEWGTEVSVLLAGYRRVTELEKELGDGS